MIEIGLEGDGWSYPVLIGPLSESKKAFDRLRGPRPLPLVTDRHVFDLHRDAIELLAPIEAMFVPRGEASKSFSVLQDLLAKFHALGLTRQSPVIAFGGGSVGDVTGLAASLFKRGCPIIHIPTTLLAQVDSAIGGKTGIDFEGRKNLIGSFHTPALVVCDPALLASLDDRQVRAGYAEIVKYGLIGDPDFFEWCEDRGEAVLAKDSKSLVEAVSHCVRAKADFVVRDMRDETGRRALLNLGHSFGHAIETLAGLGRVLHGEAVAVGLVLAFRLSAAKGLCPASNADRVQRHLAVVGLPTSLRDVGLEGRGKDLLEPMAADKKAGPHGHRLILVRGIGRAFVSEIESVELAAFLEEAG